MEANLLSHSISQDAGFFRYLQDIKNIPSLGVQEEYELATKVVKFKDIKAAHKLVTSHLKLVAKIAYGYRGYKLPVMELVSEGNIGLMHAVKKFDPEMGFRLSTYAVWWIKASIQEYILKSWSLVKIGTTTAQKKLFFRLNKIKRKLGLEGSNLSQEDQNKLIATELNVSSKEVAEMQIRTKGADISLNSKYSDENDSELIELIMEKRPDQEAMLSNAQENNLKKKLFNQGMESLNQREREIIKERMLKDEPATLEHLSQVYNISRERVRQIESKALEKLTVYVQEKDRCMRCM